MNLVRFPHNWNGGRVECWNNGLWDNGVFGKSLLVNIVGGDFKGWQTSLANVVYGSGAGLQIGVYNYGNSFRRMQQAAVNHICLSYN